MALIIGERRRVHETRDQVGRTAECEQVPRVGREGDGIARVVYLERVDPFLGLLIF